MELSSPIFFLNQSKPNNTAILLYYFTTCLTKCHAVTYPAIAADDKVLTECPFVRKNLAAVRRIWRCFENTSGGVKIRTLPVGSVLARLVYRAFCFNMFAGISVAFAIGACAWPL
jgi:hypothetical protein